jgi:hypothetical protein
MLALRKYGKTWSLEPEAFEGVSMWRRAMISAAAVMVAAVMAAAASAQPATAPAPAAGDDYAQIQLALELDQKCPVLSYFEQQFLWRAGDVRFTQSAEFSALDRQRGPNREKTATDWRTARTAEVTRLTRTGCADATIALAKGRDYAYLEMLQAMTTAVGTRVKEPIRPGMTALTTEERQLAVLAGEQTDKAYADQAPAVVRAATVIANQRAYATTWLGLTVDHNFAFTTLRFEVAAMQAGYRVRVRHIEQPNQAPARMAEMTGDGKPKLQVISDPEQITVPRNESGKSTAYAVTLREPSGALLFGLYGEEAPSLGPLPLRGVMLGAGGPREGVRVTGAECPFDVCFRFSAATMAQILPVITWDNYLLTITERATNANADLAATSTTQMVFRNTVLLAAANQ